MDQAFNRKAPSQPSGVAGNRALNHGAASPYSRQEVNYNSDSQGEGYGERGPPKAFNASQFVQDATRSRSGSQSGPGPVNGGYDSPSTYAGSAFPTPISAQGNGASPFTSMKNVVDGGELAYEDEEIDADSIFEDESSYLFCNQVLV